MDLQPYLLHPAAVHFPIALLLLGLAAGGISKTAFAPAWNTQAVSWLLWLGTASAWLALGLGVVAQRTAPHVPLAWEVMEQHRSLAWYSVTAFTLLSIWRFVWGRKLEWAFLCLWLVAAVLIVWTGLAGGRLVFEFGLGNLGDHR